MCEMICIREMSDEYQNRFFKKRKIKKKHPNGKAADTTTAKTQ